MDVHSINVDGPFLHGEDRFDMIFDVDATDRNTNERTRTKELEICTVKDGKIV